MALISRKPAFAVALIAATALTSFPASAAQLPVISAAPASAYDSTAEDVANHRWYRRRDRINGGDVVAGVLVLGAIAAIASSANNRQRDDYREAPVRYREPARRDRAWNSGGIETAISMCVDQVERGRERVDSVDSADRGPGGWNVGGTLDNGDYFRCRIDNDGRIRSIDMGDGYALDDRRDAGDYAQASAEVPVAQGQLSDDVYARARLANRSTSEGGYGDAVDADIADEPRPAYPGGPLPGEEGYEAGHEGDGRYDIAARQ